MQQNTSTRSARGALVSDIGVPGTEGYALMRQVRAFPAAQGGDVPAAAITPYARDEGRLEALRSGFQTYMVEARLA